MGTDARTLRSMIGTADTKLGHFLLEFDVPGIGHLLRSAGCEFTVLDMEHSGFGIDTIRRVLRYLEAAGVPTIVRVPSAEYHHVARVLDLGAEGLMVPMVGSAEQLRRIASFAKYPPVGRRGIGLGIAHDRYEPGVPADTMAAANERTTLFPQIETIEGLENVEEIAAEPAVDCLWVGHFDLSASLGIPGEFDHPRFEAATERIAAAARANGKSLGRIVSDVPTGVALRRLGFDFLAYLTDAWLFRTFLAAGIADLRRECGQPPS